MLRCYMSDSSSPPTPLLSTPPRSRSNTPPGPVDAAKQRDLLEREEEERKHPYPILNPVSWIHSVSQFSIWPRRSVSTSATEVRGML